MKIERATPEDHVILTQLTNKSKAFWGYSQEQIEKWSDLLTITADHIQTHETYKLVADGGIIAYYSIVEINASVVKLDSLFVLPDFIGKGLGKMLILDLFERLDDREYTSVTLDAEPFAEKFYASFGFETVGKLESSIPGRFLPIMTKSLR